jgi:hypothetical protein
VKSSSSLASTAPGRRRPYDFPGGAGGAGPIGGVVVDAHGNIFGATYAGGKIGGKTCKRQGCGIVFEITP